MNKIINGFNLVRTFLNPTNQTQALLKQTKAQTERVRGLLNEYHQMDTWQRGFFESVFLLTDELGVMFWRKDHYLRYIMSSPLYCKYFFGMGMELACLKYMEGKTDTELIKEIYHDNEIENTFEDVCVLSDQRTISRGVTCYFFEAGKINNQQILLYVTKIPLIEEGDFKGILGFAWDLSNHSTLIMEQLNRWIYSKVAKEIYMKGDRFVYELDPEIKHCDLFSHICPYPERSNKTKICVD